MPQKKDWPFIAGFFVLVIILLFLMALVGVSVTGSQVPCSSRGLIVMIVSIGFALSSAFVGGSATVRGHLPIPFASQHPIQFAAAGGLAMFLITLAFGTLFFSEKNCVDPPPARDGYVLGQVFDIDDNPAPRCSVNVAGGGHGTTDGDGQFRVSLSGIRTTGGSLTLHLDCNSCLHQHAFEAQGGDVHLGRIKMPCSAD